LVRQAVKPVYLLHRNKVKRDWIKLSLLAAAMLLAGAGCKQQKVSSYEIPKEDYSIKPFSMPEMGGGSARAARPEIKFTAPKDWQEKPAQMGSGAFHVEGGEGKYADVKIIPLRAGPQIEQQSVNMWRETLGLPELPPDQIKGDEISVAGAHAHLYDLKSDELKFGGKFKSRTTAAVVEQDDTLWFIKMDGEESIVTAQQAAFKDFLKSIRFEESQPTQVASAAGGASSEGDWKIPEGWQQRPASQMVLASYTTAQGGVVSVSRFDGATGGLLANVNRWRGQMGQGPIASEDLNREVKTVDLSDGSKASAVDVTGTNPQSGKPGRLFGLIVTRGSQTWFYKLTGEPGQVAAEAPKLVEFAGTAH
jgi:hypothetical protein